MARLVGRAKRAGPARKTAHSAVPGRRPGTKPVAARHSRPVGPWRPVQYRAVPARGHAGPGRAGPLAIYSRGRGGTDPELNKTNFHYKKPFNL